MKFYVYAIRDTFKKRIYIGQCENLERRLGQHNASCVKSTQSDRPWTMVALQVVESRRKARWIEHQLKRSRGRRSRWLEEYAIIRRILL
jgi:putative endonuclease